MKPLKLKNHSFLFGKHTFTLTCCLLLFLMPIIHFKELHRLVIPLVFLFVILYFPIHPKDYYQLDAKDVRDE